jgi:hypothetical protein
MTDTDCEPGAEFKPERWVATAITARPAQSKRRQQHERALQRALIEHLQWRSPASTWWTHFPAGGRRSRITGAILKSMGTQSGVPDLIFISRGRFFGLELKNGTRGRLSPAQVATHERLRLAGATVGSAGTLDEALDLLTEWGSYEQARPEPRK